MKSTYAQLLRLSTCARTAVVTLARNRFRALAVNTRPVRDATLFGARTILLLI